MGETMKGKTLLKGHALIGEGAPHDADTGKRSRTSHGSAVCECGEFSPPQHSNNQRKTWHREHKDAIRAESGASS